MALIIILIGILFLVLGIYAFKKLPGVRLKYVRWILGIGVLVILAGILVSFYKPAKGLLSAGDKGSQGNDDVSGKQSEEGEGEASPGTIVVDGSSIITDTGVITSVAAFDQYIASSDWQGGYEVVDRYAVYDTYRDVMKILEARGKTVIEERAVE